MLNIKFIDKNINVNFNYSAELVKKIKRAPDGRRYRKGDNTWILPKTIDNIRFLIEEFGSDKAKELKEVYDSLTKPMELVNIEPDVLWNCEPFDHQKKGFNLLMTYSKYGLFWEQGVGKTLPTIKAIEYCMDKRLIDKVLIVSPKTVTVSWLEQFRVFSPMCGKNPVIVKGTPIKRLRLLNSHASIFIINYDLLRHMEEDLTGRFDFIVFDESQFLKSASSQRSKSAYKISMNIEYKVLLTGTPITKDAMDIFSQFKVLDSSIFGVSFYPFRAKYFENKGWGTIPKWEFREHMKDEIKAKIGLRSQRLKKTDCLDLPDKLYQVNMIEMTPEQKRIYKDIEKKLFTIIEEEEIEIHFLMTKLMKLNQIASGFIINEGVEIEISDNKIKELRRIYEDSGKQKIVVWTLFKHDIRVLSEAFKNEKFEVIDGTKSIDQRLEAIDNFQNKDSNVIFVQEQAGATGITLTSSCLCIFYSHSYNLGNRLQAEDRLHRISQKNNVLYIDLVAEDSIEIEILESLARKRLNAEYIQGDITEEIYYKMKAKMGD